MNNQSVVQYVVGWETKSNDVFNRIERIGEGEDTYYRLSTSSGIEMDLNITDLEYLTQMLNLFCPQMRNIDGGVPKNHGLPWSTRDVELLTQLIDQNLSIKTISEVLERSTKSIELKIRSIKSNE